MLQYSIHADVPRCDRRRSSSPSREPFCEATLQYALRCRAAVTMAWRTFGTSLLTVAAWLLRPRGVVQSSPPDCVGAGGSIPGDLPVLGYTPLIERANVPQLIGSIRIKLGWPLEIFDSAVRPVIEGYAEYVQLLPAGSSGEAPTGTLLVQALEALLRALDYRRGQILPRDAPPEVIGAQMHRWTYAVFIAALLYDIDGAMAERAVTICCADGKKARWTPRLGSMRECGTCSYRVERMGQGAAATDSSKELLLLLLDRLVPSAVLEWLTADPEPMRELRDFLAGDMTRGVGVIAALVLRAHADLQCISTSDVRKAACGQVDRPTQVAPTEPGSVDQDRRGESFARERHRRADALPAPEFEASLDPLRSVAAGGDSAPIRSKAVTDSPRAFSSSLIGPEFLEDFGERHRPPSSQPILGVTALQSSPSPFTGKSSPRLPAPFRVRGRSPEANRFMDWVQTGMREGSLAFNEAGAMVHFVPEGMLLVSPRIFTHYAMRSDEDAPKGLAASGGGNMEMGKAIQREVLHAGWHVRGRKGINILTYQVMRGDKPVSRLSGVVIRSPERFVTPVPPVNPLLIRLSSDRSEA